MVFPQLEVDVRLSTSGTISVLQSPESYSERLRLNRNPQKNSAGSAGQKSDIYMDEVEDETDARKCKISNTDSSQTVTYKCQTCTFQTEYEDSLTQHMLTHTEKIIMYGCKSCSFKTKRKDVFKMHELVHKAPSEIRMYPCKYCSYRSKYKGNLKKHMRRCKISASNKVAKKYPPKEMRQSPLHETNHKPGLRRRTTLRDMPVLKKLYRCTSCPFQTKYEPNLKRHVVLIHDSSKNAKIQMKLKDKQIKRSGIKLYKCTSCSFQTKYDANLKRHMSSMHNTSKDANIQKESRDKQTIPLKMNTFRCPSCSFRTKYKNSLDMHMLRHNYSSLPKHKCEFCAYEAIQKAYLDRHVEHYHGKSSPKIPKMFQCKSCPYQTMQKGNLNWHNTQVHNVHPKGENDQGRSNQAKDKGTVSAHIRKHDKPSGEKIYRCTSCSFKTKYNAGLKRHGLLHKNPSKINMFQCDYCAYETLYKCNLKTHTKGVHKRLI